ncbi:DUF2796 domain-containing protein [Pseudomonas sp. NPDC007930]|uniref:DUF2796 domain-containing protein n=1 Tax=Pseudomonas sp. NPDC007930 TaxID=3364417 RepID=UPI0036E439C1
MRVTLLALPFALLPLAALAHDDHEHGSLAPHEHGVAQLNLAVDGQTLEIELDTPAMNVLGFEHPATSVQDKTTLANAQHRLGLPGTLFALPAAAKCIAAQQQVQSALFGNAAAEAHTGHDDDADDHDHEGHEHADIHAHYQFQCDHPEALVGIGFEPLFQAFPGTHKLTVQAITGKGQQAMDATPANTQMQF